LPGGHSNNSSPAASLECWLQPFKKDLMNPKFFLLTLLIYLSAISFGQLRNKRSFARVPDPSINWDSTLIITKKQFDSITLKCTNLFYGTDFYKFTNNEHSLILRLLNSGLMVPLKDTSLLKTKEYSQFLNLVDSTKYINKLLKKYPDYLISRGMGYYFPELRVEYYGTPHLRSYYYIEN
jgi:CRISPR/Cas system-associated protein endoribonuclease Cas2